MINILLDRDSENVLKGFRVKGHALYASHGEDIVCSAVSVLAQTAVLALKELAGVELEMEILEGSLTCRVLSIPEQRSGEDASLIMETMVLGLKETAKSYPGFISIKE